MENYSVLLVDDDPKLLELLANYFRKEQFTVLTARDGEEALRVFRKDQPQLLVLDLMLPKIDGALRAVASGVESVVIKQAEALLDAGGTTIRG